MFEVLRWFCVALFTVSIPLLVLARHKHPEYAGSHLIVLATLFGWALANAHAGAQHLEVDAERLEESAAFHEAIRNPPPPVKMADGSWTIIGPGISEFWWEEYHPVTALIYGPSYLFGCWLAAWAFFRRSPPRLRRAMFLISIGVLLTAWTAILGELVKIKPPVIFSDGVFIYGWNPFFGPQFTLPLAVLAAWLIVAWLPTALARVYKRPIRSASKTI
jgi:hypothetical protein